MQFGFFAISFFMFGAMVGSFLNVCIYRIPRGISILRPHRSFCPVCRNSLQSWELVPIFSWVLLKGRCNRCRTSISTQYPCVELLTGMMFAFLGMSLGLPEALGLWVLCSFLIICTFIDLETLTIPDVLTLGGIGTGILLSVFYPAAMGLESVAQGLLRAGSGSITGYIFLWGVLEIGKRLFGKQRLQWRSPQEFYFLRKGESVVFECAGKIWKGEDIFVRKSDELTVEADSWQMPIAFNGREVRKETLLLKGTHIQTVQGDWILEDGQKISGKALSLTIPREAMGWGDVKLLSAIGAFIGASGALFTVFCASFFGAIAGICILLFRGETKRPIPFGPFLAIGTLAWILGGQTLWKLYLSRFST